MSEKVSEEKTVNETQEEEAKKDTGLEKIKCECGAMITKKNYIKHSTSQIHLAKMQTKPVVAQLEKKAKKESDTIKYLRRIETTQLEYAERIEEIKKVLVELVQMLYEDDESDVEDDRGEWHRGDEQARRPLQPPK